MTRIDEPVNRARARIVGAVLLAVLLGALALTLALDLGVELRQAGADGGVSPVELTRIVVDALLGRTPPPTRAPPLQVAIIGPPGAGKSSQSWLLARVHDLERISTGDLLRLEVDAGTETGRRAQRFISRGELVPDVVVLALVKERLADLEPDRGIAFDGFPRTLEQARDLTGLLREIRRTDRLSVVYLDVHDDVLIDRLLTRGRDDDTPETIRRRIRIYEEETAPLLDYYSRRESLVRIDGDRTRAQVFEEIRAKLGLSPDDG